MVKPCWREPNPCSPFSLWRGGGLWRHGLWLGALLLAPLHADPVAAGEAWYIDAFAPPNASSPEPGTEPDGILMLGPIIIDAAADVAVEATNNINSSPKGQGGTDFTGGINFATFWEAVQGNQFNLSGQWVRNDWLNGNGPDRWSLVLEPGSSLRFPVRVADVEVTPFLDLSRTYDPGLAPTVSNTATFEQTSYDGGLQVSVPLRNMTVQLMALRGVAKTNGTAQGESTADRRMASARLLRSSSTGQRSGVEIYAVAENFKDAPAGSSQSETARIFGGATLGPVVQVTAAVGVESIRYSHPLLAGDSSGDVQLVGDLELTHRMRKNLRYTLRIADEVTDNFTSDYYRGVSVGISPAIDLNEFTLLSLNSTFEHINESLGAAGVGHVWQNGVDLQFKVSKRLRIKFNIRNSGTNVGSPAGAFHQTNFGFDASRRF